MSCFIVADDEPLAARIRAVLDFHKRDCPKSNVLPASAAPARLAREPGAELVVAVLPADPAAALELVAALAPSSGGGLLAVGSTADARLVVQALRAGARDYLDKGDLEAELAAALKRLAASNRAAHVHDRGRVIALLAPSGGAGSSTLAVNLAAAMATEERPVGLFDLKLESGDLAALLDLKPTYSIADLCKSAVAFDKVMLERSFSRHDSGVSLLAAPRRLGDSALVRPEGVARAIELSRSLFSTVVVDVDHTFRDEQFAAIGEADVLAMVFRLDFSSLRNVHRAVEHLTRQGFPADRVRLVVNRAGQPAEVPRAKAEEALGAPIAHAIPEDARTVARANNNGAPFVIEAPTTKVARAVVQLAEALAEAPGSTRHPAREAARSSWLMWRRRGVAAM